MIKDNLSVCMGAIRNYSLENKKMSLCPVLREILISLILKKVPLALIKNIIYIQTIGKFFYKIAPSVH